MRPQTAPARKAGPYVLLRLLRPEQYIKNAFVFGPLIFSGSFTNSEAVVQSCLAAAVFSLASSAGYVFNDLKDLENDRAHPKKCRTRPLASGEVTQSTAKLVLAVLIATVLASVALNWCVAAIACAYMLLSAAYTLRLKHIPVLDIFTIAAGFLLRVYAGAVAVDVVLSFWMFVTTLCLALFIAATKRKQELAYSGTAARGVLESYGIPLLDGYIWTAAVSAIVFYGLFVATVRPGLIATVPFVIFGLFRYMYVSEAGGAGESPTEVVLRDAWIIAAVLVWAGLCVFGLWPR